MNIINKVPANIQSKGHNQLGVTFQKCTVNAANIEKGDKVTVTTLENGSILIEKVAK